MIEIDVNLADTPQVIEADSGHLQQVLMNLVINSDHAMASGGKITISTKTKNIAERYIKPDYCSSTSTYPGKGEYVLLSVTDTGEGISKEELNYIFDPFFTTKQMGKGTGLGLTMVYEIVKNHSGYIICCSTIGKGTIFEIYFPTTKKQAKEDIKRDYAEIECGTETILVVDDEPYIRNICESALQNKSYNVITASNAIEGLNIYEEEKIDLVILDINMPGMGGNQCLEKLLELDPKAKVIMSSGSFTDEQQLQKESLSGAKKYISKPYNIQNLLSVIRYVLDS
jgi:CheY-like chemotaxis protein